MTTLGHTLPPYINGRFADIARPQGSFSCQNPARPTDILAIAGWNREMIDDIVSGMAEAQARFGRLSFDERFQAVERLVGTLRDNAEEIKSQMMLELSRSRVTVEEEWRLCERLFEVLPRFARETLSEKSNAQGWTWNYAPVGLVLISSTVGLPVYTILSSLLPALVAGNAVAIKPSSHCPLSSSQLANCVHQAQIPAGLVQVVYGDFEVFRRLILTHRFDVVLYTGGEETREQIRKDLFAYQNTRLVLCTAGKNAAVVLDSAALDTSIERILYGMCADAGQRVEATGLVFVAEGLAAEFCERMVRSVKSMPIGVREDLNTPARHVMGPLCSHDARERFLRFQGIAYRESNETLRWGKSIDNPGNGYFVSPGVHLLQPDRVVKSVYARSAFFGPDVAIVPVSGLDQAIHLIDELDAGHIVSVHTQKEAEVRELRERSRVPFVYWNRATTDLDPELPMQVRGHPDSGWPSGLGFLFSTVHSKLLAGSLRGVGQTLFALALGLGLAATPLPEARADYKSSVEGNEVVKGKFYPKSKRLQLNLVQGGMIMNQSFIDTYLLTGALTYHFNEWHAVSVDGFFGISKDRPERKCVENFFFNTERAANAGAAETCDLANQYDAKTPTYDTESKPDNVQDDDSWTGQGTPPRTAEGKVPEKYRVGPYQRKPAYMPIRVVKQVYGVNYQFTPVYGKALWFLSQVGYLDFYGNVGLGLTLSDFYPRKSTTVCNKDASGNQVTGTLATTECDIAAEGTNHPEGYGEIARPVPIAQTSPTFQFGLGSRFFMGRVMSSKKPDQPAVEFLTNIELRNFTVFGADPNKDSSIMNFFAIFGGFGVLF